MKKKSTSNRHRWSQVEDNKHQLINKNMPVTITKTDGYRVSTPSGVHAKGTTKGKAESQARLLRGVEHGWKPTGKPAKKKFKNLKK